MTTKDLPVGDAPEALNFDHFPTPAQAVIWRNWGVVPPSRLAAVLKTDVKNITQAAYSMGLRDVGNVDFELWQERGYLTIIRRNWHLLPYSQLLELLNWNAEKMAFALKEDDFLYSKLGHLKPQCKPVTLKPLDKQQQLATKRLREIIEAHFADESEITEPPFEFLKKYGSSSRGAVLKTESGLKLAYSYSAVYGDPLLNSEYDPYPEKLLEEYAANGINGVWLQGTLYTLVPWLGDTKYSAGWELRQENLRKLVRRAGRYGIRIYLYMNEPRNMPLDFFERHPQWREAMGTEAKSGGTFALCTSKPEVLIALRNGMSRLFSEVSGLGGVFTITMSENLTHCRTRPDCRRECPVCSKRPLAEFPAEVNRAIAEGIHSVDPGAEVIAWTWAWGTDWDEQAVELLPKDVKLMCVSESDIVTDAMGIKGCVFDYSMSKAGPGPTARRLWKKAAECGLQTVAKVQFNNTWECSAVPYIPVPDLVEEQLRGLKAFGISDLMISWTLGGYPGGNLELLQNSKEDLALKNFGAEAAPLILKAWREFSEAFREFPLHMTCQLYDAPQNYGPMNLLFAEETGYKATMIGFPYDDLYTWRGMGHYPENVFEEQFRKMSEGWGKGIEILLEARAKIPDGKRGNFEDLWNVAETVYCHFASSYFQIRFIRLRNSGENETIISILDEEIVLAKRLLEVIKRDSRIGFEASNHYYYTENDLKEKVLNCEYLKSRINNESRVKSCFAA